MKIAGFVLLQLSALFFSMRRIGAQKREMEALGSFCAMLQQLDGALGSEAPPMPELICTLTQRCSGAAMLFLRTLGASMDRLGESSFSELWRDAVKAASALSDRDAVQALNELGSVLGRYELDTQLGSVRTCRAALDRRMETLRQELPQTKRLTLGLSLAASVLLGIILI